MPRFHKMLVTCCNIGFIPFAPGTFGSLLSAVLFYLFYQKGHALVVAAIFLILTIVAIISINCYINTKEDDPCEVVIDEFCGQMLTNILIEPVYDWQTALIAFLMFRAFDILKPWPISYLDENIHKGVGIMLDDLVAGLFAALSVYFILTVVC